MRTAQSSGTAAVLRPPPIHNEKPPAVSCRGFSWRRIRRSGSEVALNANVQADSGLVLELVDSNRLRSRRGEGSRTRELLVEEEAQDFGRERQVLDRSPTGDQTEFRDVEVRVAAEVCAETRKSGGDQPPADVSL